MVTNPAMALTDLISMELYCTVPWSLKLSYSNPLRSTALTLWTVEDSLNSRDVTNVKLHAQMFIKIFFTATRSLISPMLSVYGQNPGSQDAM